MSIFVISGSFSRAVYKQPVNKGRKNLEKNVSAKQCLQEKNTRLQSSHEHKGRSAGIKEKAGKGTKAFIGLTGQTSLRYPRSVRIRSRGDYLRIQGIGRKVRGRYLILLTTKNDLPYTRFGITVSRRNGNAVRRNSVKRKIREAQRLNRGHIYPGNDIVVIARQGASGASFQQLEGEFLRLVKQAGLMEKE